MKKKTTKSKAKELGIDMTKVSVGSLIDRLHESESKLSSCQGTNVAGAREVSAKATAAAIKAGRKTKKVVKDLGKGVLDAACPCEVK